MKKGGILRGNHDLAMQAQRERQVRRNAANAQALAHVEAHRARMTQRRTEMAIRTLGGAGARGKAGAASDKS
jgi:hypothetical protein